MEIVGAISKFPERQFLVATGLQAKGLDRLVNNPADALRQLGAHSLSEPAKTEHGAPRVSPISTATEKSLPTALVRQNIEEAARASAGPGEKNATSEQKSDAAAAGGGDEPHSVALSPEQEKAVQELKTRDREVRSHEQAHKAVGGRFAGAIAYDYQQGPDGRQYAIGGEVPIDASPEATPEATIAKMRVVIAAALAPAEPSAQDRAVAQAAQSELAQASADARAESQEARESQFDAEQKPSGAAAAFGFGAVRPDHPYDALAGTES